jgi:GntR family transcriptional regulator
VARLTVRGWIDDEPFAVTEIILPPDGGSWLVSEDKIPTGHLAGTSLPSWVRWPTRSPAPMRR